MTEDEVVAILGTRGKAAFDTGESKQIVYQKGMMSFNFITIVYVHRAVNVKVKNFWRWTKPNRQRRVIAI